MLFLPPPQFTLTHFEHRNGGFDGITIRIRDEAGVAHLVKVDGSSLVTLCYCSEDDDPSSVAQFVVEELNLAHISHSRLAQAFPVLRLAPYDQGVRGALTGWLLEPE